MQHGTFVLRRDQNDGGGYVAPPGSRRSYVRDAAEAWRFPSREDAMAEACGNEAPVDLGHSQ